MIRYLRTLFTVSLLSFCFLPVFTANPEPVVTLGETQIVRSTVLNKEMSLSVHLPENYDDSNQSYPVLYMMGSHYHARFAMLAATLDYMAGSQIPPTILVGIDLPEGNRMLLPDRQTGNTSIPDNYIGFIEKELVPYVDSKYRTVPFRTLYGASNSGFFSTYFLLSKPETFNAYFASSPSIGAAPELLKKQIKDGPLKQLSKNRFFHIVYSDDDFDDVRDYVPDFSDNLLSQKPGALTYKVDVLVNQGHVPAVDFITFLLELYPDYNPPEQMYSMDKIKQHYGTLTQRYGYQVNPPFSLLYDLGIDLALDNELSEADKVFQYCLQNYPNNKKSYLGMGVVFRERQDVKNASLMFEKALAIDPDYGTAKRLLNKLGK